MITAPLFKIKRDQCVVLEYKLQTTGVLGRVVTDDSFASPSASWYPSQRMTRSVNIVPGRDKGAETTVQKLTLALPNGYCCSGLYAEAHSTNTEHAEKDHI